MDVLSLLDAPIHIVKLSKQLSDNLIDSKIFNAAFK